MQREVAPVSGSRQHRFRHDGKSTAYTGEAAVFGKTAKLNRAVECTGDLENGMGNFTIGNVRFIRCIEEQKRIVFVRIIDPARKLRARCHCTSWIVGKTKINQI